MAVPQGGPSRARQLTGKPAPPKRDIRRPLILQHEDSPWPKRIGIGFLVVATLGAAAYRALGDTITSNAAIVILTEDFDTASAAESLATHPDLSAEPPRP
jgi:hypothetical protein